MSAPVVVGVEGTLSSQDAVVWAARAAAARGVDLELLHAVSVPMSGYEITFDQVIETRARELLDVEVARAREAVPGLTVTGELIRSTPGRALTQRSAQASLVVVGSHHQGRLERLLSGSMSYQVAAGAQCPVVVAGPGALAALEHGKGVVVGADGSPDGLVAVELAAAEADRAGQDLHVVHAWEQPAAYVSIEYLAGGFDERMLEAAQVVLGESVAGLADRYPDLVVHQHVLQGEPATVLVEAAKDAGMLVVGSRGLQGVARMLLGSVSHTVVLRAPCPVMVARPRHHDAPSHS